MAPLILVLPAAASRRPPQSQLRLIERAPHLPRVPSPAELALTIAPLPPRDRLVALESVNTGERAIFNIGPGGYVRSDQMIALERFFRCRRTARENPMDPAVLELLADVAQHWPGRVIEIISGFRAPPFGVAHSRHFIGHAVDLRVRGVDTAAVRDYVWGKHQGVGVGFYEKENFVHVDSRPEDQEAAWSGRGDSRPGWAKRG